MGELNSDCQRGATRDSSKSWPFGVGNERVRPSTERPGGVPLYIQLIRLSTTHLLTGASKCMERGAAKGRSAREACRWKFANLAAISRPLWIRYRCRSSRTQPVTPLATTLVCRQPPSLSPCPSILRRPPRRMVVRDPRLTRARPLFSTRWSFVDAFLFVIPFVIPLPLFVAYRRVPRVVADAVIVEPRIAADKTGREGVRSTRARENRDDDRARETPITQWMTASFFHVANSRQWFVLS